MTGWAPLLAQLNDLEAGRGRPLLAGDALLIIVVGICLTLLLVPWAVHIWRRTGRRKRKYKRLAAPDGRVESPAKPESHAPFGERQRSRGHRPRNPTLAEVGGLPPLRPEGTPPPALP